MPLLDGVTHHGVLRLEIEYVKFIDAWRHHQQRTLMNRLSQRRVLYQLKQAIFKDDGTFCGSNIFSHFKCRLIGL